MSHTREDLGGGRFIYQSDTVRFGEDAVRLAAFAAPKPTDKVCDLGTGGGILPLLFCVDTPPAVIDAVELDPDADALAAQTVRDNGLDARIRVHAIDWNDWRAHLPAGGYSLVTCNPPYFPAGGGKPCADGSRDRARHEASPDTLSQVCRAAAGLLQNGGDFCLCHRPERLCDVVTCLRDAGLEPKRLHLLLAETADTPWLLLCRARKGGRPGLTLTVGASPKNGKESA